MRANQEINLDTLQPLGISLILALQSLSPALDAVMKLFSVFGTPDFFIALIPLLYWCVGAGLGARFFFLIVVGDSINGLFKLALHAPRPYWIDTRVKAIATEPSYGVPSGHAQSSLVTWAFLARAFQRGWGWAVAVALILLIAFSRMYLGVHFPHDILGGWIIGLGVLAIYSRIEPRLTVWLEGQSPGAQHLSALIWPAAILILWGVTSASVAGVADPPEWEKQAAIATPPPAGQAAIDPRSADVFFNYAGVLYGASVGLSLMRRHWRFDAGGPLWRRAARFAVGIVGVLALRFGLGAIFPSEPLAVGYALRFVRYALIGLWAMGLAPWVFLKLKLAEAF